MPTLHFPTCSIEIVAAVIFTLILIGFGAAFQFEFFLLNSFALVSALFVFKVICCLNPSHAGVPSAQQLYIGEGSLPHFGRAMLNKPAIGRPPSAPLPSQVFLLFFLFQVAMISVAFLLSTALSRYACLPPLTGMRRLQLAQEMPAYTCSAPSALGLVMSRVRRSCLHDRQHDCCRYGCFYL